MAEPTTTAGLAALAVTTAASSTAVTILGIPLGLRADILVAGLFGCLAAIVVLNSVPSTGDTWRELRRTTARRIWMAIASSLCAGYLTPLASLMWTVPESLQLCTAFVVGAFAQRMLVRVRGWFVEGEGNGKKPPAAPGAGGDGGAA